MGARPALANITPVPTKEVEVHLENEVKVAGEQVVLGDVATIYSRNLKNFKALSQLVISRIPEDKNEIRLPASYLEARVRAALPPGMDFALNSPKEIVFKLERLGVTNQDFSGEVLRLARVQGKIPESIEAEVVPLQNLEALKGASLSSLRIEPSAEMEKWKGDMAFKVFRKDSDLPPIWVKARVRWFRNAWLASRQLGYSEPLNASLFTEARVETTNLREEPLTASAEELSTILKSAKMKRVLVANAPLLPSFLERKPDAQAGSSLRVVFISESGVRVSADGALLAPGLVGSDAKAKLRASRKIVTGKLVAPGVMEVSL